MEPTVLAGPIEFSPAEIAAILAVLVGLFVVLTSPGWVFLAYAAHRRRAVHGPGLTWPAALGGALAGLALSGGVAALMGSLVQSLGGVGFLFVLLAAWGSCAALAWLMLPAGPERGSQQTRPQGGHPGGADLRRSREPGQPEGWGR